MPAGLRIASLLPSATEIACALGLGEDLVGVSHECDFPSEVVDRPRLTAATLEHAGTSSRAIDLAVREAISRGLSPYRVDEAALARLRPDVILTQDTCRVCAVTFDQVEAAVRRIAGDHTRLISLHPMSVDDVLADILRVADACGVPDRGETLVASLRARLARVADAAPNQRPKLLHVEWLDPPMIAGHWTPELLRLAGGDPLLAHDRRPTTTTPWSTLEALAPDLVTFAPCGFPIARTLAELDAADSPWRPLLAKWSVPAVVLDGNAYFNRPGPRLVDSAERIASLLHQLDRLPRGYVLHGDRVDAVA